MSTGKRLSSSAVFSNPCVMQSRDVQVGDLHFLSGEWRGHSDARLLMGARL